MATVSIIVNPNDPTAASVTGMFGDKETVALSVTKASSATFTNASYLLELWDNYALLGSTGATSADTVPLTVSGGALSGVMDMGTTNASALAFADERLQKPVRCYLNDTTNRDLWVARDVTFLSRQD